MISVVMPVWITNKEVYQLTANAINSISSAVAFDDCELIIVDNASEIGADQLLENSHLYIRNNENLGYPAAVNQGIKLSKGNYIAVANNDVRVSPNWVLATNEIMRKLPKVGSLHFKMVEYNAPFSTKDDVWETGKERWCTGSFFIWRKKAIDELEFPIDEKYGLGGYDDYDWQYRMREKCGWKTAYTNGVAYQHKDSTTQNLRDPKERSESDRRNYEYFKKQHGVYPDKYMEKKYSKQFTIPWRPFP